MVGVPIDKALHVYQSACWDHLGGGLAGVPVHVNLNVDLVQVTGGTGNGHVVVEVERQITVADEDSSTLVPACPG